MPSPGFVGMCMSLDFLNPWMLAGLAGIALPVLAHLLSRKRYDTVDWAAMQFLELDPSARRKLRLEDWLLLAVRIGLIALITFALARPWISGGWLGRFGSTQSRDVAIVIDRSDSMLWQGAAIRPDRAARDFVHDLLAGLSPGDTVTLFAAGDSPRLIVGPTRDFDLVARQLDALPPPAGTSQLATAALAAAQVLTRTTHPQRDLIIVADRQAHAWQADDAVAWQRLHDLRELAGVPVRIWACDISPPDFGNGENITVERLQLSRAVAVPDAPVRVTTNIRRSGGAGGPRTCRVELSLDDARQPDQTLQVRLPEQGMVSVEFEPRFRTPGSHLVSVSVDTDALPGDDRADGVVLVRDGLPALLIDGAAAEDPTRSETFFAQAALAADEHGASGVRPTIQTVDATDFAALAPYAVIVLANVETLNDDAARLLAERVKSAGVSLLIAAGDRLDAARYRTWFAEGRGWLPCRFESIATDTAKELSGVQLSNDSLELPWLQPFRTERGGSLTEGRFTKWWKVAWEGGELDQPQAPVIAGRLTTGDPWLLFRKHGRGTVAVLTSSLDADWNTLPANADYVPLLHELLFFLANTEVARNVEVGQPLVWNLDANQKIAQITARDPLGVVQPLEQGGDDAQRSAMLSHADRPGVYRWELRSENDANAVRTEYFVMQPDRGESDLTPLTDGERAQLTAGDQITFVTTVDQLQRRMTSDSSRTELWWLLLYAFLCVLALEAWLTRRLVRGGQVVDADVDPS